MTYRHIFTGLILLGVVGGSIAAIYQLFWRTEDHADYWYLLFFNILMAWLLWNVWRAVIKGIYPAYVIIAMLGYATLSTIVTFAELYKSHGLIDTLDPKEENHNPADALYFSTVTFTTLGYGDFRPSPQDRLPAAAEALIGYFILAVTIASSARALSGLLPGPTPPTGPRTSN